MNNQKDAGTYFIIKQLGNLKLFHKEEWKKYLSLKEDGDDYTGGFNGRKVKEEKTLFQESTRTE